MDLSLFRQEVAEAKQTSWHGNVVLIRPVSFSIIVAFALTCVTALICLFAVGKYAKHVEVSGVLLDKTGSYVVTTRSGDRVVELKMTPGQSVGAGDVLYPTTSPSGQLLQTLNSKGKDGYEAEPPLLAPLDGAVSTVYQKNGFVSNNVPSLAIMPLSNNLYAVLFVPRHIVKAMWIGQRIEIHYPSYPDEAGQQAYGRVDAIQRAPTPYGALPELIGRREGTEEDVYRVKIQIASRNILSDGRLQPLAIGAPVVANIVQRPRSILSWLLVSGGK
jgi:multidrug efflux pump subunit AcrA (membrane-fusion protein)